MEFYFQNNSVMNSLKCSKSKSLSHCLTELFPFYQNKNWTIQRRNDGSVDQPFHCILSKIVGFLEFRLIKVSISRHHVRSGSPANFQSPDCQETRLFPSKTQDF